ncbi:MAG: RNA polymerase sigma-70 factor [Rikenellaceae bacterium]|nr:RNA polymerase sigma-70 factor [Rikenellaceae bacterium]MCL2691899.1 RNA polymerase sigma-70 factor [Rikenellaceae bacterium]
MNEHDNGAFEQMFHCYYSALCFYADKIVKDNDLSRDIVQDVFLKFYEKKPVFDNIISLRTYLYRSVFNACINYIKKYNRSAPDDKFVRNVEVPESEDNYLYQLESRLLDEIFLGIKSLPDKCRQVFELSYIERCSIKEISRRLNISENTVKSQKARAKQLLKERLRDLYSLLSFIFF